MTAVAVAFTPEEAEALLSGDQTSEAWWTGQRKLEQALAIERGSCGSLEAA